MPLLRFSGRPHGGRSGGRSWVVHQNSTYARSNSYQYDPRAGGDSVYVDTRFYFYGYNTSCGSGGSCYWYDGHEETTRSNSASWKLYYKQHRLDEQATSARARIHVCEDQAHSGDPCSANTLPTFGY